MSDKSEIHYWLRTLGEAGDEIHILTTDVKKVPEVGEVINLNTQIDKAHLEFNHQDITKESLHKILRRDETQVSGDFVVVNVKRKLRISHQTETPRTMPPGVESSSVYVHYRSIPVESTIENFEVFIEPFRHTELTETPIAKLRNMLSPMYGYFQMMQAIKESGEDNKELMKLVDESFEKALANMDEIIDLVKDKKIWK